ncbi:MAG: hypothetical protein L3K04_01060 [Thermoplasmata archaeon]|nr:hypothetical protein [Thermoplasmata archaeon]MCI4338150.1 hypothetical protein [Thermoplasmata archaeon]MCI4340795.1 hypothetical protein [Thermoplasmata archaeon]
MQRAKGDGQRPSARDEAEQLARDLTRDIVHTAYTGYKIASRVGRAALKATEKAANDVLEEIR